MTDWWKEVAAEPSAPTPAAAGKTDWWSETKPPGPDYTGVRQRWTGNQPPQLMQEGPRGSSIGAAAKSSFPTGLDAQIKVFARSRGIPEDRYKVIDGMVAYQADDGQFYAELPRGWNPREILRNTMSSVGPSMSPVTGATVGILTAPAMLAGPGGLALSMGATGLSAAAADAARQQVGSIVGDQPLNPLQTVKEGVTAGLGQGIGAGMTSWASRYQAPDLKYLDSSAAQEARRKAQAEGVPLTPAEETNLSSLKAQQKWLGNATQSQNIMQEFYQGRNEKVQSAIGRFLDRLSGIDSAEVAGARGQKAAQGAIDAANVTRRNAAKPLYQATVNAANVIGDDAMAPVLKDDFLAAQIAKVKADKLYGMAEDTPAGSLPLIDLTKRNLDDMIETARRTGENNRARLLTEKKNLLLQTADDAFPDYAKARAAYAGKSPEVEKLTGGMVGRLAETDANRFGNMAKTLFGANSGPVAIREAKDAISKVDPEAWGALKRAWMQDVFEKSAQEYASNYGATTNVAGKFAAATRGNLGTLARIKAALDPSELDAFNQLTDVLRSASAVKPIGSDTEFNRLISKEMTEQARGALSKIAANINPIEALKNFDAWLTNRNMGQLAETLATAITQPGASQTLRQIKQLPRGSVQWRAAIGHLLTQGAAVGASQLLGDPAEAGTSQR